MSRGGSSTRVTSGARRGYSSELTGVDLIRQSDANKDIVFTVDETGTITPSQVLNSTSPPTGQAITLRGTTPPASPADGDQFWDTTDECLYYYDLGRLKWLSVEVYKVDFGRALSLVSNSYFYMPGRGQGTSTYGFYTPYEFTVVGYSLSVFTASTSTIEIRDNGTSLGTFAIAAQTVKTGTKNNDIAASRTLTLFARSGGAGLIGRHGVSLFLRRRES